MGVGGGVGAGGGRAVGTWSRLDLRGSHFSEASPPCHVPRRLRHTFPSAYRLGLNLTHKQAPGHNESSVH